MTTVAQSQHLKLEELVRRIVEAVQPLRIILFGSAARGEAGPDSDIDVLVVMPEGTNRRKTQGQLYVRMLGLGVPIDIVVATPGDLERYGDTKGLIYRNVVREGTDLYVQPGT
ncbi:MAG: nucleotidyltransferase domain-containing protein [Armatimonadia bacterium]